MLFARIGGGSVGQPVKDWDDACATYRRIFAILPEDRREGIEWWVECP